MMFQHFHIFQELIPSIGELDPQHIGIHLIIINEVGVIGKPETCIIIDAVIDREAQGFQVQLLPRIIAVNLGFKALPPRKVEGGEEGPREVMGEVGLKLVEGIIFQLLAQIIVVFVIEPHGRRHLQGGSIQWGVGAKIGHDW